MTEATLSSLLVTTWKVARSAWLTRAGSPPLPKTPDPAEYLIVALALIKSFEGFEPTAKWDVNAYRLGYGSDTKGPEETPVKKGDTTTEKEAEANLLARLPSFERKIILQIGDENWKKVPDHVKPSVLSLCYNYGHLPLHVTLCLKDGDYHGAAEAILALRGANGGINSGRRVKEASLILLALKDKG